MENELINSVGGFTNCLLPKIEKRVFRMGVSGNYGIVSSDILWAADHGVNYWVWGTNFRKVTDGIREAIKQQREKNVLAVLGWGYFGWQVRNNVEKALRALDADYIDVFKLGWLGKMSAYRPGIINALLKLKQEGKIKAIGTSIHDRKRAGKLAIESEFDLFMIRYNAKHPGAEVDIFPHVKTRNPAIVSYTALAWQQLIKPIDAIKMPAWPGDAHGRDVPPLTPELCYRFVLSNPHVHVVLTGPKTREQLMANLRAVEQGPLTPEELDWVRQYGQQLRTRKRLDYVK